MKYHEFTIYSCGHGVAMFESRFKNKGLVNSWFISIKMCTQPNEFKLFCSVETQYRVPYISQTGIHWSGTKKCVLTY